MNTVRLQTFARLIALGEPPVLAAKGAAYRNLRASRAAMPLAAPATADGPKALRTTMAKATRAAAVQISAPLPQPMMTEAQWLAAFHPTSRGEARARG